MFEVKSAGYSLGMTKYRKDAELWFKEANRNMKVQLFEVAATGRKTLLQETRGHGFDIRSISKLQPSS